MRKCYILAAILSSITIVTGLISAQNTIDVVVEGISDGVRNTKQKDRDEAIMDAKLKAIERAGVDITSVTTIENFQLKKDWIESKAKASILPGFQIVEVGYAADGLYHVVLSGKVTSTSKIGATEDNPAGIEFVFVKGGTFQMGDTFGDGEKYENPVHTVTVSDFYLGKTEVTVAQFRVFCNATGRAMPREPEWGWQDDHPVLNLTWNDCQAFCRWVGFRMPTEAEWEYAARGGNQSLGFKYSGSDNVDDVAWYKLNSVGKTHSVGTKMSNELGLYDMSGNVEEFCSDWYEWNYYSSSPIINPRGPLSGDHRTIRNSHYLGSAHGVRCTYRAGTAPDNILFVQYQGFRCARTP